MFLFLFTGSGFLSPTMFLLARPTPLLCKLSFSFACMSIIAFNSTFILKNCRSYLDINLNLVDLDDDTYQRYNNLQKRTSKISVRIMIVICFIVLQVIFFFPFVCYIPCVDLFCCQHQCIVICEIDL